MTNKDPNVREIGLGDFLAAFAGASARPSAGCAKRPIAEDVAKLKAAAERYSQPLPFAVGDLVTPRADSPLEKVGRPHIVLALDAEGYRDRVVANPEHVNNLRFDAKLDMRVASVCDCPHGEVTAYWEESWMFEPWTSPAEASEPAPESPARPAEASEPAAVARKLENA